MKQLLLAASTTDSSGSSITEPAAAQLNALQKWWASIDWESIIGLLIQKALMLLFLCILFGILLKISNMIIDRIYRSYEKKATFNVSRINTIHTLIRNTVHYTLGFFFVYALLSTIGVPVSSLLAGAGVVGVALGLGAHVWRHVLGKVLALLASVRRRAGPRSGPMKARAWSP